MRQQVHRPVGILPLFVGNFAAGNGAEAGQSCTQYAAGQDAFFVSSSTLRHGPVHLTGLEPRCGSCRTKSGCSATGLASMALSQSLIALGELPQAIVRHGSVPVAIAEKLFGINQQVLLFVHGFQSADGFFEPRQAFSRLAAVPDQTAEIAVTGTQVDSILRTAGNSATSLSWMARAFRY